MTTAQFDHKPLPGPVAADERRAAGVHRLIIELFYLSNVDSVAWCRCSRPTAKPMGIAAEFRWYGMQPILAKIFGEQQRYRNIGG